MGGIGKSCTWSWHSCVLATFHEIFHNGKPIAPLIWDTCISGLCCGALSVVTGPHRSGPSISGEREGQKKSLGLDLKEREEYPLGCVYCLIVIFIHQILKGQKCRWLLSQQNYVTTCSSAMWIHESTQQDCRPLCLKWFSTGHIPPLNLLVSQSFLLVAHNLHRTLCSECPVKK